MNNKEASSLPAADDSAGRRSFAGASPADSPRPPFPARCPVALGENRLAGLADDVDALVGPGSPVLLVSDPGIAAVGLTARASQVLRDGGHAVAVFTDVRSDPVADSVDAAAALAREFGHPCCIVGLGGGSALDVAKLAAAVAVADHSAEHYALAIHPLPDRPLPKILIPTTAGTGSEVTRTAVFTAADGRKVWAWGGALTADLALLDPALTLSLPPTLTAATGLDALVHAIEACTARRRTPRMDEVCHEAIRLIARHLPRAVARPDDLEARRHLLIASTLAGIGIDACGTGVAHALGHALGALAHVHHGRTVALSLAAAMAWNAEAAPEAYAAVAAALGAAPDPHAAAPAFAALLAAVGLDRNLSIPGLTPEALAEATMAPENAPMRDNNPRAVTAQDAHRLAATLLRGG
jgi:alcohol dehydrogenase class IV